MGKVAEELRSQFTVALGDNFYGFGVKSVDDPRFQETYEVRICYSAVGYIVDLYMYLM